MHHETIKTQTALAELLHGDCPTLADIPHALDLCVRRDRWMLRAASVLGHLMPVIMNEMIIPAREAKARTTRELVAASIERELVCCDLYDQINEFDFAAHGITLQQSASMSPRAVAERLGLNFHAICHWGGYAASIARNECPSGKPRCEPLYWCPTAMAWESPCHGGFDVCCDLPDLHQTFKEMSDDQTPRPAETP